VQFRYPLTAGLAAQAADLEEFANGAAQCHVRLNNGSVHAGVLIGNGSAIVAMRGQDELPFPVTEIDALFQSHDDKSPPQRGEWKFFDAWSIRG
jgi:hypothetical protein